MARDVTVLVPPQAQVILTGISRIDIGARVIKGYGLDPSNAQPRYRLTINRHNAALRTAEFPVIAEQLIATGRI